MSSKNNYKLLSKSEKDYDVSPSKNGDHINIFIKKKNGKTEIISLSIVDLHNYMRWANIKRLKQAA